MKTQNKGFTHILALLVLGIMALAFLPIPSYRSKVFCKNDAKCPEPGIYFQDSLFKQLLTSLTYNSGAATESNIPKATNPTESWQTYENKNFNFSIKYPAEFELEEDNPINPFITIIAPDNSSNLLFSPMGEGRYTTQRNREQKLTEGSDIVFADRQAREYRQEYSDKFTNVFERDIQIKDVDNSLWSKENEISYWVDKSKPEYIELFDQILSSFEFIN